MKPESLCRDVRAIAGALVIEIEAWEALLQSNAIAMILSY
jgi:hypothetical protein